ncbi:MAG: type II toxin-antitoxin system VapC family toxin [Parvularculaceae bacterium]|nr:type II toxin-antitoxin system VapC family toxin [Parvularculaceae bacterium]
MIAVDTSAIYAMIAAEPEEALLRAALGSGDSFVMSAGNVLELQLVTAGRGISWEKIQQILESYNIAVRAFDEPQLQVARAAVVKYGRGRHPAKLNYGDCFAYALAKSEGAPLLYVGGDFALTDVRSALA